MSDFYSETKSANRAGLNVFVVDDVGSNSIDRAKALLAGIPHGADKAIGSAIKCAAQSGEAYAARAIREHYVIKAGDFKSYTKSKRKIVSDPMGTSVEISFTGRHIPLMKFDTKIDGSGRVSARVKRSSARTSLDHVFAQSVGSHGHEGVFERRTSKRLPIEEKFGPSTPQMMDANDDISQEIGDKMRDVFDERIVHEVHAILNGWRR